MDHLEKQREQYQVLQTIAEGIAASLCTLEEKWEHKPVLNESQGYNDSARLIGPNDQELSIRSDGYYFEPEDGDRLVISGIHFTSPNGNQPLTNRDERHEITVSPRRPVAKLAADIRRRFLPKYIPVLEKTRKHRQEIIDRNERELEMIRQLQRACKGSVASYQHRNDHPKVHAGEYQHPAGSLTADPSTHDNTVKIELSNVPLEVALSLLRSWRRVANKAERAAAAV